MTIQTQELEIELQRVMHDVILSLLGESTTQPDASVTSEHRLACRVAIHGQFEGHVAVLATSGVTAQIAIHMFGADLSGPPTVDDSQEALREVANIVAGNLKPLFGDHNSLGLPEDLPNDVHLSNRGQLAEATAQHTSGTLEVRVYATL